MMTCNHCLQLVTMQAAQSKVAEAVAAPASEREFQPTSYLSMAKAHLASEKVGILSLQIASMQGLLEKQGYARQPPPAGQT
jgi:septal ring-binding cell division protein DamX